MQEEIEQKSFNIMISTTKLSARTVLRAVKAAFRLYQSKASQQWASEFLRLYPNAKLLVTSKKDFEPGNRKKFCARIATGDYDAVIIGHSQFEKIPLSAERQERLIQEQMDEIEEAIEEAKAQVGEHFTVKQLEKLRKSLKQKLEKLQGADRKDDVVTFEQLGVDRLFVDESQAFKNLYRILPKKQKKLPQLVRPCWLRWRKRSTNRNQSSRSRVIWIRRGDNVKKREHRLFIRVTDEERNRILDKMYGMGIHSLSAYIRKMALDGYCLNLDLPQLRRMAYLLQNCSNNLNQVAKRANENGKIYSADLADLRTRLDELISIGKQILTKLANL